ncbi:DUF2399 domain-containing protein [Gracilibacillus alcaliphilus]|uniref:DUF2399 domain-containing protein n=1 Tax=Gracilibacillus alcaliphilus TaxID=1401441 RepID=UPI0019562416|nr:DUF2399 domain-containing protein [Gracilibacillus alcaliphilus]MBM7677606.1 hypothetical protein [Gracilibacillus alcaliphilus]
MIPIEWNDYLNNYILLKHETLHVLDAVENKDMIEVDVIKRTVRTRRTTAKLTFGLTDRGKPPEKVVNLFPSPYARRQLSLTDETYEWMRNGWVIREYRLGKDERTIKKEQYRMGLALFQYQQKLGYQKEQDNKQQLTEWINAWQKVQHASTKGVSQRTDLLNRLADQLALLAEEAQYAIDHNTYRFKQLNASWRLKKQVTFLHFLLALYQISAAESHFDWKQIGARYYRVIGGSKMFDTYKREFIEQAEQLTERPLQLFGLTSLGSITPIYFTGSMQGRNAIYQFGSMHATTDLAVFTDQFSTNADVLWLVENRGVLTRMAYEQDFVKESNSLVLAMDGQLRSAHRQLIHDLAACVQQVIIWTDVDEAGLVIAREAFQLTLSSQIIIKWVVPPLETVSSFEQFEARYQQAIRSSKEEQEQEIGGVQQWKTWIKN